MKYTIEDLRNGKCAVINDGTLEELMGVLSLAFPDDSDDPDKYAMFEYYFKDKCNLNMALWYFGDYTDLPTQSVKDFIKPSIEDKIKELKELAKSQGMDCDVVLSEKKRIDVSFLTSFGIRDDYKFVFKTNTSDNLHHAGEFLAKQLENYLNQE